MAPRIGELLSKSKHYVCFLFQRVVAKTNISFNIDGPEGSLDAMMQVAACEKVTTSFSPVFSQFFTY